MRSPAALPGAALLAAFASGVLSRLEGDGWGGCLGHVGQAAPVIGMPLLKKGTQEQVVVLLGVPLSSTRPARQIVAEGVPGIVARSGVALNLFYGQNKCPLLLSLPC